ncbi:suppressor of fused domain protein [Nocardia uniformis]|uniref:Suppressor of fused domain protein n=1 Tax=Nocardia uniformis TaxID=53432 RepID=A0A849CDQ2_9NOCA|nr:suppressor of fused domain protein [Nocardia uniformis]NNH71231.1 suppressor of fused domain protein [Nocardia uniformis]
MSDSIGHDSIDKALGRLYGTAPARQWGPRHPWAFGGPDLLDMVRAYPRSGPIPHWHYIGFGMSGLYGKESPASEISGWDFEGWGFEVTFRLVREPDDYEPPMWPGDVLQNLSRYVCRSGKCLEPGDAIRVNGPIVANRQDSAIRAVAVTADPELGTIATLNGTVRFLQVVGLTLDEFESAQGGDASALMERLVQYFPLYVTDIDRESLIAQ